LELTGIKPKIMPLQSLCHVKSLMRIWKAMLVKMT
jgi:hypothetical protein